MPELHWLSTPRAQQGLREGYRALISNSVISNSVISNSCGGENGQNGDENDQNGNVGGGSRPPVYAVMAWAGRSSLL